MLEVTKRIVYEERKNHKNEKKIKLLFQLKNCYLEPQRYTVFWVFFQSCKNVRL